MEGARKNYGTGRKDGWMDGKDGLRIVYSKQKRTYNAIPDQKTPMDKENSRIWHAKKQCTGWMEGRMDG